jgi:hypothetical protein
MYRLMNKVDSCDDFLVKLLDRWEAGKK